MKEESEFILLTFSLVVVGESELFSIGDLAACGGCASNRQLALTLSPCRPEQQQCGMWSFVDVKLCLF